MPTVKGIAETALYVDDLERSGRFYETVLGFGPAMIDEDRMRALPVPGDQVLLLFKKHGSTEPTQMPGGAIPPHDGDGHLHLAFRMDAADVDAWKQHLQAQGIALESEVTCDDTGGGPGGGTSLYVRDPDGHLLELITPGCWTVY